MTSSARRNASSRSPRSCPPRSRDAAASHLGVVEVADEALDVAPPAPSPGSRSRSSPAGLRSSRWYSSLGISSIRSRSASPPVAREQLAQTPAVLDRDRLPAGRLEHAPHPAGGDVGHDAVERLPVEVDDPQHLAEPRDHRVDERLPDRALVELGVADQRDLAPALRHVEVPGHVAVRDRAPDRRGRADPDRAGREVDDVRILGPARVALQAAELAQRRQVAAVELAEQVVDGVQHRRGVRLHRDAVGARRCSNHSAVMMLTIEADDAWCPPTFTPDAVVRTLLAWWTMLVASHSTRRSLIRDGGAMLRSCWWNSKPAALLDESSARQILSARNYRTLEGSFALRFLRDDALW